MTQPRYTLQEKLIFPKIIFGSLVNSLRDFVKRFDEAIKCLLIPLPETKSVIVSTMSKNNFIAHNDKDILSIQIDKFVYRSDLKSLNFASIQSKILSYTVIA